MNWGKGIVIGMVLFMSFIVTLVVIMINNDSDLVTEDYYNKELEFNQQYDAMQHYADAKEPITLSVVKDTLFVFFPKAFQKETVSIELKRPNNETQDTQFDLVAAEKVMIPTAKMPKGVFDCIITGNYQDKAFEFSESVTLK